MLTVRTAPCIHTGHVKALGLQHIGHLGTGAINAAVIYNQHRYISRTLCLLGGLAILFSIISFVPVQGCIIFRAFFTVSIFLLILLILIISLRLIRSRLTLIRILKNSNAFRDILVICRKLLFRLYEGFAGKLLIKLACHHLADLHNIWQPIAHIVKISRLAWQHNPSNAIFLHFWQKISHGKHFIKRHIRLDTVPDFTDNRRQLANNRRSQNLLHYRPHKMLLAADTANISFAITIADILDSLLTIHMLQSWIKVNNKATVIIPRILIIHALFDIDVNSVQSINNPLKGMNIYQYIIIHWNA